MGLIIGLVLRIIGVIVCVNQARKLGRDPGGWGVFGFFLPIIAMIWVSTMKPKGHKSGGRVEKDPSVLDSPTRPV